jgi:hypothetical protein
VQLDRGSDHGGFGDDDGRFLCGLLCQGGCSCLVPDAGIEVAPAGDDPVGDVRLSLRQPQL